jgi:hypothetical protein
MNKELLANQHVYDKIILWWGGYNSETELVLYDCTLARAYESALRFGYNPPVWYKPWQYLTGGLGVVTVG